MQPNSNAIAHAPLFEEEPFKAEKPQKAWNIERDRWGALGFHSKMSIEEAKARAAQLNVRLETRRQEERRQKLREKEKELSAKFTSVLPEIYKAEFERRHSGRRHSPSWEKSFKTSWNAVQRMLIKIQLDPADWYDEAHRIYDYFCEQKHSFSYVKKNLLILNLWGQFLSKKLGQQYYRIPIPRGAERARIIEAYFGKTGGRYRHSDPITPGQLEKAKSRLKNDQYNWIYLSVWLGLRPTEVDQLKNSNLVRLQNTVNDTLVLWVYQTKLVAVPPRYRWKLIPIIFKEQQKALEIIKTQRFERPLPKTVRKHFGDHTNLYGGRKGFTDLMMKKQQSFVNISQWMGHSSIDRTWRHYKSRRIVHFD